MSSPIYYSQQRSLNVGIAMDTGSLGAAAIYDDLVYAQKVFGDGYFYRSYDMMMSRFPLWSERTIRNYIRKLEEHGWVSTKIKKVNGKPTCHYQICRFLSANVSETKETVKIAETYNDKETKKETTNGQTLLLDLIALVNPKEKPTADRVRVLNGRLKDYTSAEIRAAAAAFSKSEWHRENKQMSIDNLLAPSKFGRWYEQSATDKPKHDNGTDQTLTPEQQRARVRERQEAAEIELAKERGDYVPE